MMPSTAEHVQTVDPIFLQKLFDGALNGLLQRKDSLLIYKCLSAVIEINIFNVKIGKEAFAIP